MHDLLEHGYEVLNADLLEPHQLASPFIKMVPTDLGETFEVLRGAEGMVNLAAVPAQGGGLPRAVEELSQSSFVEIMESKDGDQFITVPLVAAPFGKRKSAVNLQRNKSNAELQLLHAFGVTKPADIAEGIGPQID